MSLLRIEALTVRHGGITALDNQTLDVAAGEIVMVTGPNGAGKSSLLSCVAGYVKPWQGGAGFFHGARGSPCVRRHDGAGKPARGLRPAA